VLGIHPRDGEARELTVHTDPWRVELEHFLACVRDGAAPSDGTFAQARAGTPASLPSRS